MVVISDPDQESLSGFAERIDDVLKDVDFSKYVKKNGEFNKNIYNIANQGRASYSNRRVGGDHFLDIEFDNFNVMSDILMGVYLLNLYNRYTEDDTYVESYPEVYIDNIPNFYDLQNLYEAFPASIYEMMKQYLDHAEESKIGAEKKYDEDENVSHVKNIDTNRFIKVNSRKYKQIYRNIGLFKVGEVKSLSEFKTDKYKVGLNCVVDWMRENVDKNIVDKLKVIIGKDINKIKKKGMKYPDIFKICKHYKQFNVKVRDRTGDIIDKLKIDGCKQNLDIIIHSKHMYVLTDSKVNKIKKEGIITKFDEIKKYNNCQLIVETKDLFDSIIKEVKKDNYIKLLNSNELHYGSNIIKLNCDYEKDFKIMNESKTKCKNLYNYIDSILKLRGCLDDNNFSYFVKNVHKIRYYKAGLGKCDVRYDLNKAYPSQIKKKVIFPVPCLSDKWEIYNPKQRLLKYGLYYCEIKPNKKDSILAPISGVYTGYAVEILKKKCAIKKIVYQFICNKYVALGNNKIKELFKFDNSQLRRYIGWLMKSKSSDNAVYYGIGKKEGKALLYKYGEDVASVNGKMFRYTKTRLVTHTGVLANLFIKELTNIELFNFNEQFMKLNKKAKLNRVTTDCLGYKVSGNIIEPKQFINQTVDGKFKKEKIKSVVTGKSTSKKDDPNPLVKTREVVEYKKDSVVEFLCDRKSMGIFAPAGYGKTYLIHNTIIPYLKKNNMKYVLASTTIENMNMHNKEYPKDNKCTTIQKQFNSKYIEDIINKYDKIDYLIIDEASQLCQGTLKFLELIKDRTECGIVLCGDEFQCQSIDCEGKNYLFSDFVHDLCDYNIVRLKYNGNGRYTKKLDKVLSKIRKNFFSKKKVLKLVKKYFKQKKKSKTKYNISYTRKVRDELIKKGKQCSTIHSIQGKTIKDKYTIFGLMHPKITTDVIYTALSRGVSLKKIQVVL